MPSWKSKLSDLGILLSDYAERACAEKMGVVRVTTSRLSELTIS
jgi:hypothetical protein